MKTFNLSKRVQIILVTLLVLIVGIIAVGIWANDEVMAAGETCKVCGKTLTLQPMGEVMHGYRCPDKNCSNKESIGTENHGYEEGDEPINYVDNKDGTHYAVYKCKCGIDYEDVDNPEEHTPENEGRARDATYHYYVCIYCNGLADTVKHEMTSPIYYDSQCHVSSCRNCSWTLNEKHNNAAGICNVCMNTNNEGCECGAGTKYLINYSANEHMETCTAGCIGILKPHNYTNGKCDCGARQFVEEKNTIGICDECKLGGLKNYAGKDSKYHIVTCSCGESKPELHTYAKGVCKYCGYTASAEDITILGKKSPCCEGGFYQLHKQTASTHTWACSECGDILGTEQHKPNENGVCEDCGYVGQSNSGEDPENCPHENKKVDDTYGESCGNGYHDVFYFCIACKTKLERKDDTPCEDDDDNGKCDICGYTFTGNEDYGGDPGGGGSGGGGSGGGNSGGGDSGGGNSENGDTECEHTYEYTNNQDGTHNSKCTKCEKEIKNEEHKYENGKCICGALEETSNDPLQVTSQKYTIKDSYIAKVTSGTTMAQFKINIQHNATEIKIYTKNNILVEDENTKMATGMKIELKKGDETKTFTIVVTGDVNGDAEVDLKDFFAINKHRLNKANLTNEYLLAGDVNFDGNVDRNDMLQINKFRLGKIETL